MPTTAQASGNKDGLPPRILVVDDDRNERTALAELLVLEGFRVAQAVTGEESLLCARALRPEAVLLDLVLPQLNGLEVARQLRELPATADVRMIATTASWLGEKPDLLIAAGFDGALRKPFTAAELLTELERVLASRSGKMHR